MSYRTLARSFLLALTLFCTGHAAFAAPGDEFLDPDQAFKLSVKPLDERTVEVDYDIAPGYHMYRDQFRVEAQGATLGVPVMPEGKTSYDETFQKNVTIYVGQLHVRVPVTQAKGAFKLSITGQGCADKGLCYPPQTQLAEVRLAGFGGTASASLLSTNDESASPAKAAAEVTGVVPVATPIADRVAASSTIIPAAAPAGTTGTDTAPVPAAEPNHLNAALRSGHFWTVIGVFFVAGLLLSLTPCVLPMLPILSSIIVGAGGTPTRGRSFLLAVSYSLGMALVYTALGVAAGLAGEGLAAALQKPWVLMVFALALVGFSLSMFGVYELQLPSSMTGGLSGASQRLPAGRMASVFLMGGVSALIVSPCVAAPLAGALVFLSQTRDVFIGGAALFALAAGMSVPLLLLGASAGALLPRAGAWMDGVKHFFGMLLLAVALWTVQPVIAPALAQALWGALLIGGAAMLGLFSSLAANAGPGAWLRKTASLVAVVYGLLQLIGTAAGGTDPLKPLAGVLSGSGEHAAADTSNAPPFQTIHSVAELDAALAAAGRPAVLDFYADWCVSCKEMERNTFSDPAVRQHLSHALLLRADVTANNADDKALQKRFTVFGPPSLVFFDGAGKEVVAAHVDGYQDVEHFLSSLSTAGL